MSGLLSDAELEAVREATKGHTPGSWKWASGWSHIGEGYTETKYLDLRLLADSGDVLPLRVDHHEYEWDCDGSGEPPTAADRALIAAAPSLLAHIEALAERDRWVPVTEKPPNVPGRYNVTTQHESDDQVFVVMAEWDGESWDEDGNGWAILAYKPLPEPYRPGGTP